MLQNVLAVLPAVETDVLEAQLAAGGARAPAGGLPATVASSYIVQLGKLGIKEARPCGGMGGMLPAPKVNLHPYLPHIGRGMWESGLAQGVTSLKNNALAAFLRTMRYPHT